MEYTRLGSSGLKVSRIALGTMGFGDGKVPFWSWALPWEDARAYFAQALDGVVVSVMVISLASVAVLPGLYADPGDGLRLGR